MQYILTPAKIVMVSFPNIGLKGYSRYRLSLNLVQTKAVSTFI